MGNVNTIKSQIVGGVQNNLAPLTNAVASTTETAFSLLAGPISGAGGGVIPLSPTVNTASAFISGTGRILRIRATGFVTGGASAVTWVLNLYQISASVIAAAALTNQSFTNWNKIASSTSRTITGLTTSMALEAAVQLSATGRLEGFYKTSVLGALQVETNTTIVTGLVGGDGDLNFVLTGTFGTNAQAANLATVTEFSLEQV